MPMSTPAQTIVREPGNPTSVRSGSVAGKKRRRIADARTIADERSKRTIADAKSELRPKEWRLGRGPKMNIL